MKARVSKKISNFFKSKFSQDEIKISSIDTLPACFTASIHSQNNPENLETAIENLAKALWFIKIISAAFTIASNKANLTETAKTLVDSIRDLLNRPFTLLIDNKVIENIKNLGPKNKIAEVLDQTTISSLQTIIRNGYEQFIKLISNSSKEELSMIEEIINDIRIKIDNKKVNVYNLKFFFENVNTSLTENIRQFETGGIKQFTALEEKLVMPGTEGFSLNPDFHQHLANALIPALTTSTQINSKSEVIVESQTKATEFLH